MNKIIAAIRFLFRKRLHISSDFINTPIKDFRYSVSENKIADYNNVVSSTKNTGKDSQNSNYIHPVFFAKISWQIILDFNDFLEKPINLCILDTIVHQSEQVIIHELPAKLTELTVKSKIIEIKSHRKGTKFAVKYEYFSDNILIVTEYSSGILFGVKLKGTGKVLEKMPWPKKIEKEPIWIAPIEVEKKLPYIYAEKADIDAPIHTNPKFAKSIGLPDIILQGTCSFAKSLSKLISKELNNDYNKIKAVSARFTGPIVTPNILNVRLLEKNETGLYFDVTTKENKTIIKGGSILLK